MVDPYEAEQWRDRLVKQLDARQTDVLRLHNYYDGNHTRPYLPEGVNNDVKALNQSCVLNLCPLVVDAVMERLEVQGFQFGADDTPGIDVWRQVWQPNQLDAVSQLLMQEALIARRAYALVQQSGDMVTISPETPEEVLVSYEPGSWRKRRAAIKRFTEGDGSDKVTDITLWLPGEMWRWRGSKGMVNFLEEESGPAPTQIPMVEFLSMPDLRGTPHSELDRGVLAIQDRINKTVYDRLILSEFQAFPQRWATGVVPEVDSDGNPIAPWRNGPNRVVVQEDPAVQFGQWDAADMGPHLAAVEAEIHALAATTKTPVHYLAAEFSNVSADAIRAAEAGLVKKVRAHQRIFGEAWEEVIRLALSLLKDPRQADQSSFVEWADPETRTVAELADATVKLAPYLPKDETWRRLGYSPQERSRFASEAALEAFTQAPPAPSVP